MSSLLARIEKHLLLVSTPPHLGLGKKRSSVWMATVVSQIDVCCDVLCRTKLWVLLAVVGTELIIFLACPISKAVSVGTNPSVSQFGQATIQFVDAESYIPHRYVDRCSCCSLLFDPTVSETLDNRVKLTGCTNAPPH